MAIGASIGGGNGAARDEDVIARLLVGGGLLRRARVRRLLLARLLNEARESGEEPEYGEDEAGEEGGMSERGIARFLIASGILRRRRVRQMVLGHLLRERREGGEAEFGEHEGFEGGYEGEEGGPSSERKIARFLIASGILRRRRVRQMVLAHLLRERREGGEAEFGEHEGFEAEEEGGGEDRRIIRQLVATGVLRKRRIRRMLLARLLRERGEFGEEGGEMEGEEGEEWGGEWGGGGRQRGRQREQMAAQ
jgi:hypothetical protein